MRSAHKPALASGSCQRKTAHASVWRSPAGGAWVFRTCRLTLSPRAAQGGPAGLFSPRPRFAQLHPPRTPLGRFAAPTLRCKDGAVKPAPLPPMAGAPHGRGLAPSVLGQPGAITCCLNTRKSRGRVPTVFVTPLQDFKWQYGVVCSRAQPPVARGRLLWADVQGHPCSHSTALLRCPLDAGRIQWAMHLVLHAACGMSADQASIITKHRARKTLVSAAPATRYPWERASHLGTGRGPYGQSVAGS